MTKALELSEMQRLLLMAAAVHGLCPGAPLTSNCGRVLGTALRWAGRLTPDVLASWTDDFDIHPVVRECYSALILMVQHRPAEEASLEGAGNFGTPSEPLAQPWFTSCRLTERGELVAEDLLSQHPGYRQDA
jgi:hypothetical protein